MRPAQLLVLVPALLAAQTPDTKPTQTLAARTAGMTHMPGLLPLDWDAKAGRLFLELPALDSTGRSQDYLYTDSLPFGTGSNDLGLDRGQTSAGRIVHFERTGPRVLLVEANQGFRGSTTDAAELLSIRQSFPESVLAGFKIEAEDASGAVLLDATDFFVRDSHGVVETLSRLQQSSYKLDPGRSAIALDHTRAFPKNTEVEAVLTFVTESPSRRSYVADVTPDPHALTLREHQSFLELPGPGFTPRRFDPRAGYFPESYRDYSAPLGAPLDQPFIIRHRLLKADPNCVSSCRSRQPIQYYVDRGAPEPIRSALVEGARWWDQAFQAAGWAPGTFRVDLLPDGADPMDVRYNIIQWVHRYTRGWSYGAAVTDPRTGEIIKGNVTLGSLRGRQDYLIAEALLAPYTPSSPLSTRSTAEGSASPSATADPTRNPMLSMVLQRIRQLAAHETGHTLGLAHNFAASAYGSAQPNGTSVMDYPHPWITLKDDIPDLTHAYAIDIGAWDKVAIDYGYREFDRAGHPVEDPAALDAIIEASQKRGLVYLTDEDARPLGSAHPHAHLWDNGPDSADELNRILTVRAAALARFGLNNIPPGTSLAQLEDTLVPLYLLHRYQTEAAIKEIGGLNYTYKLRGDNQIDPAIVPSAEQRKALAAVLHTLSPQTLTLPESLLAILPPRPPSLHRTQESFASETGLTFDPIAAAESAADLTLTVLFDPARATRLVEYAARQPGALTLEQVLEAVSSATAGRPAGPELSTEIARATEARAVEAMLTLAANPATSTQARAITRNHLQGLRSGYATAAPSSPETSHRAALASRIELFLRDPEKFTPSKPVEAPPGMPIGDDEEF